MKKVSLLWKASLILISISQLTACQKLIDQLPGHGHGKKKYRIKTLKMADRSGASGPVQTGTVYYNTHNNPDSIIFNETLSLAYHYFYFTYDSQNRLSTAIFRNSRTVENLIEAHYYTWATQDRLLIDSAAFTDYGLFFNTAYPTYDGFNRVVSEVNHPIADGTVYPPDTIYYHYNAQGNLQRLVDPAYRDSVQYDNKPSYKLTNPVWMITSKDYSKNNNKNTTGYNDVGLPLGFRNGTAYGFLGIGDPYEIEYEEVP